MGGLPSPIEATSIWHGEVHHSTAIEGNTLIQREVEQLLEEGLAVGNRTLREYLEAKGYAGAAEWVYGQVAPPSGSPGTGPILTLADVRMIHHKAMAPVWRLIPHPDATERESPGAYREHEIQTFPGRMTPVSWPLVPGDDNVDRRGELARAHHFDLPGAAGRPSLPFRTDPSVP